MPGGGRGARGILARVRAGVLLERPAQLVAQPGGRPAGDDVDRMVGGARGDHRVAVAAQLVALDAVAAPIRQLAPAAPTGRAGIPSAMARPIGPRRAGHPGRPQLERAAGDHQHRPVGPGAQGLRAVAHQVDPAAGTGGRGQHAEARLLADHDRRGRPRRGPVGQPPDARQHGLAGPGRGRPVAQRPRLVKPSGDPHPQAVDQHARLAGALQRLGQVVAGVDRRPRLGPSGPVRRDPVGHPGVAGVGGRDVPHRPPGRGRERFGVRALARARPAQHQGQAHRAPATAAASAAATRRSAASGVAAQWVCR